MSVNLANIYALLKNKFGEDINVSLGPPPKYLKNIIGEQAVAEKILFVCKENRSKKIDVTTPIKFHTPIKPKDDADLIGSPLKDDCVVDAIDVALLNQVFQNGTEELWSAVEEYHCGLNYSAVRAILTSKDFQKADAATNGSVWILSDCSDAQKTLMLEYEFLPNYFSRGLIRFMGVLPTYSIKAEEMRKFHQATGTDKRVFETSIENTYKFNTNITMRCAWTTTETLPTLEDLSVCDVTLQQTFCVNDGNFLTQDYLNQLRILSLIRDDIIAFKQGNQEGNIEPVYRCGRGIEMEELRESITQAITEISAVLPLESGNDIETELEMVLERARDRPLIDLTDKMWEILKCCTSYKNLKLGFSLLFQNAARCNVVNLPKNKNRLSEIITEVAKGRLAIPCLTGSEPLELLLEIGLDKLQKDYEFVFNESKVCNTSLLLQESVKQAENAKTLVKNENVRKSLHNAVRADIASGNNARKTLLKTHGKSASEEEEELLAGFKYSNFDEEQSAARLAKLLQIHCTLEHLLLMHTQLNLSKVSRTVCDQMLNKPAQFVGAIDENFKNEMKISLNVLDVRDHLESKIPHSRRITMKSKNNFGAMETTFFYCMDKVCPPAVMDCCLQDDLKDGEVDKDNVYYSWYYRKIKTCQHG